MKVIIVGGVAAGAGAATRLRRLDESAEIILLEKGSHVSYANCGLPYHLGGVIPERRSLLVVTPEMFKNQFNVQVRTESEVVSIDRAAKNVTVRNKGGETYTESYDKLILATGSSPIPLPIPGIEDPRVTHLWTLADMDRTLAHLGTGAKRVVLVGAGFVGLETAENLREKGLEVTVVEGLDHALSTIDKEMAVPLQKELESHGISFELERMVTKFITDGPHLGVVLDNGKELECDFAILCAGVKPNSGLARDAGLELAERGHIVSDEYLRTSDPDIFAAGDVVEVRDPILGGKTTIPLAGPANKQARVVADNIMGGKVKYWGSLGTSILKAGNLTVGMVGLTEARLKRMNVDYQKVYLCPNSNATYYPGGTVLKIKLLFAPDGKILGAQAVGIKGVDKRIDVIATAMRCGMSAPELGGLELSYAPPYNSAKDPVNLAGMIVENVLNGTSQIIHVDNLSSESYLLDIRETHEFKLGSIPGAVNIPMSVLRERLNELPKDREIVVFCVAGIRAYVAERALRQHGFNVKNLSGGYLIWKLFNPDSLALPTMPCCGPGGAKTKAPPSVLPDLTCAQTLDARGMCCPGPVVSLKGKMDSMKQGEVLKLLAPLSFVADLHAWTASCGHELLGLEENVKEGQIEALIRKGAQTSELNACSEQRESSGYVGKHSAALILFSNDLDKAMAALILAAGMAAGGAKVGIFFTFWGLSVLRKNPSPAVKKTLMAKMFGWMLPKGISKLSLSKMNIGGMGTTMMKRVMAQQNVPTLSELISQARALGVQFIACDMAMSVMGITREELIEVDEVAGVASFVNLARNSNNTLFI